MPGARLATAPSSPTSPDIRAATTAAPQATRVADRFHLLVNVREAVGKVRSRVPADVRAANAAVIAPPTSLAETHQPERLPTRSRSPRRRNDGGRDGRGGRSGPGG